MGYRSVALQLSLEMMLWLSHSIEIGVWSKWQSSFSRKRPWLPRISECDRATAHAFCWLWRGVQLARLPGFDESATPRSAIEVTARLRAAPAMMWLSCSCSCCPTFSPCGIEPDGITRKNRAARVSSCLPAIRKRCWREMTNEKAIYEIGSKPSKDEYLAASLCIRTMAPAMTIAKESAKYHDSLHRVASSPVRITIYTAAATAIAP